MLSGPTLDRACLHVEGRFDRYGPRHSLLRAQDRGGHLK